MLKEKILIIGASIVDVLAAPAERDVFDSGSYPVDEIRMSFGGDALNEATVLAALGKQVQLETIIGDDMAGSLILEHCRKSQIVLGKNYLKPGMQTGVNVVLVQKNGERNFLTNKNGSLRKLRLEDISRPFPENVGILCFASIFVFPEIGSEELAELFRMAKEQEILVCADMTKRKKNETVSDFAEALSYVDYLMPNEEEALLLTGKRTVEEAAEELLATGVGHVVVKCGKRGCYLCTKTVRKYILPETIVESVDTTGAGDSFAAGFLYGLSEDWDLERCVGFANQCGARAVGKVGATSWCEETGAAGRYCKGDNERRMIWQN